VSERGKRRDTREMPAGLPVEVARLRREFPDLTPEDVAAYVKVTRQVLGDPGTRAKAMRDVMEHAREAQDKEAAGGALTEDERGLVRYLAALAKMQRSTVKRR